MSWAPGEPVVRREIVGGRAWLGWMVNVVEDTGDRLFTYSPEGVLSNTASAALTGTHRGHNR